VSGLQPGWIRSATRYAGLRRNARPSSEARQAREIELEDVVRVFAAFAEALDRILGLEPGRLSLTDPPTLRMWSPEDVRTTRMKGPT
jgi:hypothetical protein